MGLRYAKLTAGFCALILLGALTSGCRRAEDGGSRQPPETPPLITTDSGIEMVQIPGGWFDMGGVRGPADETPQHKVWVNSFLMDRYEVTQEQYQRFEISDFSHFKDPRRPVEQQTWVDAARYCNERSYREDLELCYDEETWECNFQANGYRLPTEAEWEYACRAGTKTSYFFGDDARRLADYACFKGNASDQTQTAGSKKPNPWGLYDMYGNVAEWCNDFYAPDYYRQSPERNPRGPAEGELRVLRGGAWNSSPDSCRSAYRVGDASVNDDCLASDAIGFRCVRSVNPEDFPPPSPPPEALEDKRKEETMTQTLKTGLVYDDIYLEHQTGAGFPETPLRLPAIINRLQQEGIYDLLHHLGPASGAQPLEWIQTVHNREYIERAKDSCRQGLRYLDTPDMPISERSYEVALAAVSGVLAAVDAVMGGEIRNAFCAIRPPGHHAMPDGAMGFCMFNNVVIAARYIQNKYELAKVLIIDWDVHHGNGTQAMFYDDPTVLYFGTHQYPFYPGTGAAAEKGMAQGYNYTINVPMSAGAGDAEMKKAFTEQLVPAADTFEPDFVLISAGFDAHENDLLGGMKISTAGYAELTQIVKDIAEKHCQGRLVSLLEGGYNLELQAQAVAAHLQALME